MSFNALFHGSPVAIWEEDFSTARKYITEKLAASNQSFHQLIQENPEELLTIAEKIKILDANDAAVKTFRANSKQSFVDNYSSFFNEDTMPAFIDFIIKVMEGKTNSEGGIVVGALAQDGHKITINLSWNVNPDYTHDYSKLWFFAIDISDQINAENALKERESLFRSLYESMNEGVVIHEVVYDADGIARDYRILDVNPSFEKIVGINRENSHGQLASALYGSGEPPYLDIYAKVADSGEPAFFETYFPPMDQHFSISVFSPQKGMFVTVFTDITDRKKSEAELKSHREQLEEIVGERTKELERATSQLQQAQKMEALGVLAGGIAHDFNNIIATIGVTAEVLLKTIPYNASIHSKLERVLKSSNRAKDLTMKLLTFARKEKLNIKVIHASELVNDVIDILKRTISKKIKIEWILSDNIRRISVDFNQMVQALLNICLNACDAMPDGGILKIETREMELLKENIPSEKIEPGIYCQITISDTGEGISPAIVDSVFEPFFTTKEIGKGSGLGLAVCHSIVEEHHGFIKVESIRGEGASFSIHLPTTESKAEVLDEEPTISALPHKIGTILIIDDDKHFLQAACESLELEGYEVMVANSGRKGIETYSSRKSEIHAVIMDMMMPEMDGSSVYQAIREINPKAKILISSGYSVEGKASELIEKGAAGFIQKPFKTAEIVEMISCAMDS